MGCVNRANTRASPPLPQHTHIFPDFLFFCTETFLRLTAPSIEFRWQHGGFLPLSYANLLLSPLPIYRLGRCVSRIFTKAARTRTRFRFKGVLLAHKTFLSSPPPFTPSPSPPPWAHTTAFFLAGRIKYWFRFVSVVLWCLRVCAHVRVRATERERAKIVSALRIYYIPCQSVLPGGNKAVWMCVQRAISWTKSVIKPWKYVHAALELCGVEVK